MGALTSEERLVLTTTIMLHGFLLYRSPRVPDSRILIGRPLGRNVRGGQMMCERIAKWRSGEIIPERTRTGWSSRWKLLDWDVLSDDDLQKFHDVVVATC